MRSNTSHYECDRCHAKCDDKDTLGLAIIRFQFAPSNSEPNDCGAGFMPRLKNERTEKEWCRTCRVEVGLLVSRPPDKPKDKSDAAPVAAPPPPATFEDLLREIIREEIENAR